MSDNKSEDRYYSDIIWVLTSEFDKMSNTYLSSDYLMHNVGKKLEQIIDTPITIINTISYNFRLVKDVSKFFSLLKVKDYSPKTLIIIAYLSEDMIVRDYYLANLIKLYTGYDIAYINCSHPEKITTKVYNFILSPADLDERLQEIIRYGKEEK